jgi:hypothetical protein
VALVKAEAPAHFRRVGPGGQHGLSGHESLGVGPGVGLERAERPQQRTHAPRTTPRGHGRHDGIGRGVALLPVRIEQGVGKGAGGYHKTRHGYVTAPSGGWLRARRFFPKTDGVYAPPGPARRFPTQRPQRRL